MPRSKPQRVRISASQEPLKPFKLVVSNHKQTAVLDGLSLCFLFVCPDIQASETKLHGVPRSLIKRNCGIPSSLLRSFTSFPASMARLHYGILQLIFYACLLNTSRAFTIPLHGPSNIIRSTHHSFAKRQPGGLQLNNTYDISYYADIVLGNQTFTVLVDTGRYVRLFIFRFILLNIPTRWQL